ncbi:MAG: hypothetical protein PHQ28_00255 [Mycobacterium sp.]|nr:hypothetical protein [Mycobacterium sp.]
MAVQAHNAYQGDPATSTADEAAPGDHPAIEVTMLCELSQVTPEGPFSATLIREETRRWEDDPEPDVVETIVCEVELSAPLTEIFSEVDRWLLARHHLRIVPSSWEPGETGPDAGVVVLLTGRATHVVAA